MEKQQNNDPCFECDDGKLELFFDDHSAQLPNGESLVVRGVPMHRCSHCQDVVIGDKGNRAIDIAIKRAMQK